MKIAIAADHGGFELKGVIIDHLTKKGYEMVNLGTDTADSVDYPDYAEKCAQQVLSGAVSFGIVVCGTGIGISISANKMEGIRCALPQDKYAAEMTKKHNASNFIAFGGRVEYKESIEEILDAYIDAEFEGGRHQRRIDMMMALSGK